MRWTALSLTCLAVAAVAATAATARTRSVIVVKTGATAPFATGLSDPLYQTASKAPAAFAMTHQAGATYAKVLAPWSGIAPASLPAHGFNPADPKSPYYKWNVLDPSIAAANAAGVTPIIDFWGTPAWAYNVKPGKWTGGSPKLSALSAFATALAKHYDGVAPSAHIFAVWNEPNYNKNLFPQDAGYYRSMVNAVADAVHKVDPNDLVAAGELAPFKHTQKGKDRNNAIPPLDFMRTMFCISNTTPATRTCSKPAEFDIWTHHPYSDHGPFGKAKGKGGVELGDLPAMDKLLQTAWKLKAITTASGLAPQFWVTEVGWSTNLPNKNAAPIALVTRWTAETMYQMWHSGVTVGTWYELMDQPLGTPFQSGLYFRSSSLATAQAKPLLTPFRFPFVAYLKSKGKVLIWGKDTTNTLQTVAIQEKTGKTWTTVATIKSNSYGIFTGTVALGAKSSWTLRASAPDSGDSASFALAVPSDENLPVEPFPPN